MFVVRGFFCLSNINVNIIFEYFCYSCTNNMIIVAEDTNEPFFCLLNPNTLIDKLCHEILNKCENCGKDVYDITGLQINSPTHYNCIRIQVFCNQSMMLDLLHVVLLLVHTCIYNIFE